MAARLISHACVGVLALVASAPADAQSAQMLLAHEQMQAYVIGPSCARQVHIEIRSPSASYFAGDRLDVQRLAGGARQVLGFNCDVIEKVTFSGKVGGRVVFAGLVEQRDDWRLIGFSYTG